MGSKLGGGEQCNSSLKKCGSVCHDILFCMLPCATPACHLDRCVLSSGGTYACDSREGGGAGDKVEKCH